MKLLKMLNQNKMLILSVILIVVLVLCYTTRENFSKSPRYMWMYTPTSKNSSYDIRGEPKFIPKEMDKVGVFYDSSYNYNYTNQRLPME